MGIEPANEAFDGLESQIKLEFTHHKDHFFFSSSSSSSCFLMFHYSNEMIRYYVIQRTTRSIRYPTQTLMLDKNYYVSIFLFSSKIWFANLYGSRHSPKNTYLLIVQLRHDGVALEYAKSERHRYTHRMPTNYIIYYYIYWGHQTALRLHYVASTEMR